jgi:RNA polymerase sigma-70 factor (ECF subfamily)
MPDDRLRLIFCACHPALSDEARVALALQTICGLSTIAIARLFLVPEATVAQRLVRAKRKIRGAAIPFAVPSGEAFDDRLGAVCSVVYLLFTEGYSPTDGDLARSAPLCEEAIRLARIICHLLPAQAEPRGLLALMLLHDARRAARTDASGELVDLEQQDRRRWDRDGIAEGTRHLEEALSRGKAGVYQIQAAIAALHAEAASTETSDWVQIMALYEELWRRAPSPSVGLGLIVAEAMAFTPDIALERLERLVCSGALDGSRRVAAVRADLLGRAGRVAEAALAYDMAAAMSTNDREARLLGRQRARWLADRRR